jgi:hypothetical protein
VLNRRLAALGAVLALAGLGATACSSSSQTAALTVGDEHVTRPELFEELNLIVSDADFRNAALGQGVDPNVLKGPMKSSYNQELVSSILEQRIRYMVADDVLRTKGVEITDKDRQGVLDQLNTVLPNGADSLPARYRTDLVEGLARLTKLESALGQDAAVQALDRAESTADITVASQFGRWDADQLRVVPPTGANGAPTTTAPSAPGASGASGTGSSSG